MCGRYDLQVPAVVVAEHFGLKTAPDFPPRFNIAPAQLAPVVRLDGEGQRVGALLRWGLIPSWAKDEKIGQRTINARAETAARLPAFRAAYRARRCIVPATGFYEWRTMARGKQPYRIRPAKASLFGLAGLWERWRAAAGKDLETYTILTTEANTALRPLHGRMPVILPPEEYGRWLNVRAPAMDLLRPCPPEWLEIYPVSRRINDPRNDDASLLEPVWVSDADVSAAGSSQT